MNDALRRAIRTYLQSAIGIFLGLWATAGIAADDFQGVADLTVLGKLGMGALIGAVPALLAFVQNALEDSGAVPSVLKARASSGARPVTHDDAGRGTLGLIGLILAAVAAIVLVLALLNVIATSITLAVVVLIVGVALLLLDGNTRR